ncbi:hypothetical protein JOB18_000133 [Solea senegalensis]|uniref:Uncharacterized protein n=1 Tax=Solea senegalensis TaxID=28829 RepID=A0AAV6R339_SOLSE|nr:hypothetical protein JOB18_000133 [Solea senegalensis]
MLSSWRSPDSGRRLFNLVDKTFGESQRQTRLARSRQQCDHTDTQVPGKRALVDTDELALGGIERRPNQCMDPPAATFFSFVLPYQVPVDNIYILFDESMSPRDAVTARLSNCPSSALSGFPEESYRKREREGQRKTKGEGSSLVGLSENLSERGILGGDGGGGGMREEKIPPVPPGYRGMKDGKMERRSDV